MVSLTTILMMKNTKVIYGCDLGTLHKKLELGNLPAKEMKKVMPLRDRPGR